MGKKNTFLIIVAFLGLMTPNNLLAEIGANADMTYSETSTKAPTGVVTKIWSVSQNYSLNFNKDLTNTIGFGANINYTISETNTGEKRDNIYPLFVLTYRSPHLYNFTFSHNTSQTLPDEGPGMTSSNSNAVFNLPRKGWRPSLSVSYNRSTSQDNQSPHKVDTVSDYLSFRTGYGVDLFGFQSNISFTFSDSFSEDKVGESKTESPRYFVGLNISRSFMDDRLSVSGNIGYENSKSNTESLGAAQRFDRLFRADEGLTSIIPLPLVTDNGLVDGNRNGSIGIDIDDPVNQNTQFVIKYDVAESVHEIRLSVTTTQPRSIVDTLDFDWELSMSDDGITFTAPEPIDPVYEEIPNKRFVFFFPEVSARFFRLVNSNTSNTLSAIEVTEMEGVGFVLAEARQSFTSTTQRDIGGFQVSYRFSERLAMSYGASYSHSTEDISDRESTSVSQSASAGYTVIPTYLILSTSASFSESESKGSSKSSGFAYNLSLSSRPLPTVGASIGYRFDSSKSDGVKMSESDSIGTNLSMRLYKGVDFVLRSSFSDSTTFVRDSNSQTTRHSGDLRLRPWEGLFISLTGSVGKSESEVDGERTTTDSEGLSSNMSYKLTRTVYISGRFVIVPNFTQSYFISWVLSRKIQASLRAAFTDDTTIMGGSLDWRPLRRVSFSFGFNSTENDRSGKQTDSLFMRASLSF